MVRRLLDTEHRAIPALREALRTVGFEEDTLMKTMGAIEVPTKSKRTLPRLLKMTDDVTPFNTLLRCFLFRVPVERKQLAEALPGVRLDEVAEIGLIHLDDAEVRAAVAIFPVRDLLLAVDDPDTVHNHSDSVMPINTSTLAMIYATVRRPNGSALDMGCGCGVQALFAARHSKEVYASDLNPRAVNFTAFNARLNGMENIRSVQGSGYDAVTGKRFDLIVGNLPFAIIPGGQYVYRDSGEPLDTFAARIIAGAPEHLNEDGFCQYLCEWIEYEDQPWQERLIKSFEGSGSDALCVVIESNNPIAYAEQWIAETEAPGHDLELFRHWTGFYEENRIKNIVRGWVMLRRRSNATNWFRVEDTPLTTAGPWGDTVLQIFAAEDFLSGLGSPRELLDSRLVLSRGVELVQFAEVQEDRWTGTRAQIMNKEGLRHVANVDQNAMLLLPYFDGQRTVLEALRQFAERRGADVEAVIPPCLPLLRHMIERGILLPV